MKVKAQKYSPYMRDRKHAQRVCSGTDRTADEKTIDPGCLCMEILLSVQVQYEQHVDYDHEQSHEGMKNRIGIAVHVLELLHVS